MDHEAEKRDLEAQMTQLEYEQKGMESEIPAQRSDAEENAWQDIDKLEDKNKALLLYEIERGVKLAADLTEEKTRLLEAQKMRSDKVREIEEKNHEFERLVKTQKEHRDLIK